MVEFYPTSEWLEQKLEEEDGTWRNPSYFGDGDKPVITDQYGWTPGVQSLHEAEWRYAPDCGEVLDTAECQNIGLSEPSSYGHQSKDIWEPKNLTDLDDGYNEGEYVDSWTTANAGAPDDEQIVSSGSEAFPGGFAGECESGQQWQLTSILGLGEGWACSGEIPWTQEVFFPDVNERSGKDKVGFFIMPYNVKGETGPESERDSYYDAMDLAGRTPATLDSLNAVCWNGSVSDKPGFSSDSRGESWFAVELDINNDVDHPIPVFGELDLGIADEYSCQWKYTDSEDRPVEDAGGVSKMSNDEFNDRTGEIRIGNRMTEDQIDDIVPEWESDSGTYDKEGPVVSYFTD